MSMTINHPLFGRGSLQTMDAEAPVAAGAAAQLVTGDGARIRLILRAAFAAAVDPEQSATVSDNPGGVTGALAVLTAVTPVVILKYEDIGDVIFSPLSVFASGAGLTVTARSVRFVREGGG